MFRSICRVPTTAARQWRPVWHRCLHDTDPKDTKVARKTAADAGDSRLDDRTQPPPHNPPPSPPPPPTQPAAATQVTIRPTPTEGGSGGGGDRSQQAPPTSFETCENKNRSSFVAMVEIFESRSIHRRQHVEFIYAALRNMELFGVHRDLEVYKALMNVLPKGKYIPQNMFQAEFQHYPKQQQVIIDLLEQMEDNAVVPDHEMQDILVNTFGRRGHPTLKYWRMLYWMPKFKNLSPWLLPDPVPDDGVELARLAVERMCSVDLQSEVRVFETAQVEGALDRTWIVSGQSAEQAELLRRHPAGVGLRVEGPMVIWLRDRQVLYFVLRGDAEERTAAAAAGGGEGGAEEDEAGRRTGKHDVDDVSNLRFNPLTMRAAKALTVDRKSVHSQDDGTIYAICATGTSTKDSLLSWIRLLEQNNNPVLGQLPVLFKFRSSVDSQLAVV